VAPRPRPPLAATAETAAWGWFGPDALHSLDILARLPEAFFE